jgi:UDP-N-acetylglucosamine 1-carboxyvinyltransferase
MYIVEKSRELLGEVNLHGAKNSALPIIVAACLCQERVVLNNIPLELNDVQVLVNLLRDLGFNIEESGTDKLIFDNEKNNELGFQVAGDGSKIRYSLLLLSLLLQKTGRVKVPCPGGCNIGDRKYDIHLDSLQKMGAIIEEYDGFINGKAEEGLSGASLKFHIATTSGTENVIIGAVLAKGTTIIENANTRPEVIDLINFLNLVGADIKYKTRYIEIKGVQSLMGGEYTILSGTDEAVTYMILAGMTRGEVKINNFDTKFIQTDVSLLREIGLDIFEWGRDTYVSAKRKPLKPFSMATAPYPGINSDMQPLFAALAATIEGESIITDMRFTDRFQYVEEFKKFGVDIENYSNCAIIQGGKPLTGTSAKATDLRGGTALILLGCVAEGTTEISNEYQVNRGYIDLQSKLNGIGCNLSQKD